MVNNIYFSNYNIGYNMAWGNMLFCLCILEQYSGQIMLPDGIVVSVEQAVSEEEIEDTIFEGKFQLQCIVLLCHALYYNSIYRWICKSMSHFFCRHCIGTGS